MILTNKNTVAPAVLTTLLLSFLTHLSFSQAFTQYNLAGSTGASINFKIEPFTKEIEGSPYYEDEWKRGTIYNKDNTFTQVEQLKYNLHIDELVFMYKGTQYLVPFKGKIKRFTLGEESFIGAFNGEKYSFYEIYEPGENLMLLKNFQSVVEKGSPSKGYIPATKDKFIRNEKIYLMKPDHDAVEINPRKGLEVLPYLHDRRDDLEVFIKNNRLKMKKLEDLVALVRHYNALCAENTKPVN